MPRKKKIENDNDTAVIESVPEGATKAKDGRVLIRVKEPADWMKLLTKARVDGWRLLQVTFQIRDRILAGKPAELDAANAMLKARGLEDQIEAVANIEDPILREQAAERIAERDSLCEFTRRPGHEGIWMPANNIKAGLKENWSVLGKANENRGSRKALAEGVFVCCADSQTKPTAERDWIYMGAAPSGIHTAVSHVTGPTGPINAIKRHEYVERPIIKFDLYIAKASSIAEKFSDVDIAQTLAHFEEHGVGACRSQGFGRFDVLEVRELDSVEAPPETESVQAA